MVYHSRNIIDIIDVSNDPAFSFFRIEETYFSMDTMVKQSLLPQSFLPIYCMISDIPSFVVLLKPNIIFLNLIALMLSEWYKL